jgi:hypothetical protein
MITCTSASARISCLLAIFILFMKFPSQQGYRAVLWLSFQSAAHIKAFLVTGCMRAVEMHSIHRNDPDAESTTTERRGVKF